MILQRLTFEVGRYLPVVLLGTGRPRDYWKFRSVWLALGNPGDVRPVGSGISELRIDYGSEYRVYFVQPGKTVVVILCGGDKRTQAADIEHAVKIAADWEE